MTSTRHAGRSEHAQTNMTDLPLAASRAVDCAAGAEGAPIDLSAMAPQSSLYKLKWVYQEASSLIENRISDCSLSVERVMDAIGCSRSMLYRAFALHQCSIARAIRQSRLRLACQLLATPPYKVPIETLAYRCGFSELRTFNRSFRREFGMTAGEFRAQLLREELTDGVPGSPPELSANVSLPPRDRPAPVMALACCTGEHGRLGCTAHP